MEFQDEFRDALYKMYEENKRVLVPKELYLKSINDLREASGTTKKTPHQYYLLKNYEILKCGDIDKLIKRRKSAEEVPLYFVTIEDTYDTIKRAHIATGHGGRDKMLHELNKKYANITIDAVSLFKSMCMECQRKRKRPTNKGTVVKPILSKDFNSRAQVDLIDMQSMSQGQFKWIMVYQDHLTKFCVLRSLTSKRAAEVAYHLLDIFLLLGAPCVLQSDNGSEFTAQVVNELKLMWPALAIVHGKPRHPQSQGSVERANCDIKDMLVAWLGDNKTNDWTVGLKFVQFQKNTSLHSGIKRSPFAALLGSDARIGLSSSTLPHEILQQLQSEDDLLSAIVSPGDTADTVPDDVDPSTPSDESTAVTPATGSDDEDRVSVQHNSITENRKRAREAQEEQATRMVKRSKRVFGPVSVGDNVTIPIPHVDRGRGDPRNIIGVVTECGENGMFTIAVKGGVLNGKYSRNQFDVCVTKLFDASDFNTEQTLSLRQAVQFESVCGGQGYIRCNCAGAKRCQTNRCKCFKANLKCNSRCHSGLHCSNKLS